MLRRIKYELRFRWRRSRIRSRGDPWLDADRVRDRYRGGQCVIMAASPHVPPADRELVAAHPHVIAVNAAVFSLPRCTFGVLSNRRFNAQLDAAKVATAGCEYFVTTLDDPWSLELFAGVRSRTILTSHLGKRFEMRHSWNIKGLLPWGPTIVLDTALPLAVWCGFDEILLVGCQYPLNSRYERLAVDSKADRRSLDADVAQREMALAHRKWALWAQKPLRDVRIINCTPDSDISVFPRAALADRVGAGAA